MLSKTLWLLMLGVGLPAALLAQPKPESTPEPATPPTAVVRPPVAHFAALPLLSGMSLSPDGQRIAVLYNQGDTTVVATRPVAGGRLVPVLSTDNSRQHFNWARWVGNDRLVVSLRFPGQRYFTGTMETRLVSVKADGGGLLDLNRSERNPNSATLGRRTAQLQDRVVDWLPGDGRHVLLEQPEAERDATGVVKLNVETGGRTTVLAPAKGARRWIADAQHRVRAGLFYDELQGWEVRAVGPDGGAWRTLWRFKSARDDAAVWPMGFDLDPQLLYVSALHQGRRAVFGVRLDDPALPRQLMVSHPVHDVDGGLLRAPGTGEVLGVAGGEVGGDASGGDGGDSFLWSPPWQALQKGLNQALPGRANRLFNIAQDGKHFLMYSSGNRQPGQYFYGDREAGTIALVADTYPELAPAGLAGKQQVAVKARDGLPLNLFVTLPAGRRLGDGGAPLPLVLLPHGGPQSRDDADFDTWTEFLASRGLAVLQVNFRGSDGYGSEFAAAGLKRWGLEMQDDLTDALQWAVARRVADGGRVCIVGASYGGYAALMGAVKTPELYRCAISFAGVSNLPDLILTQSDFVGGREAIETMIGRFWGDREQLRATSPALQAARIRAPVLLVHGTVDRSVPVEQSQQMADALRSAGKTVRYVELDGGDHHLSRQAHRLVFFREMEAFLDQHLALR